LTSWFCADSFVLLAAEGLPHTEVARRAYPGRELYVVCDDYATHKHPK
jgi:hypothetical protein